MEAGEFNQKVDNVLLEIEDALDTCEADLDWDSAGGILTIECDDGSQVIINRQEPTRQIWVAAKAGGFHFDYFSDDNNWRQDTLELFSLLNQCLSEQTGTAVSLERTH